MRASTPLWAKTVSGRDKFASPLAQAAAEREDRGEGANAGFFEEDPLNKARTRKPANDQERRRRTEAGQKNRRWQGGGINCNF